MYTTISTSLKCHKTKAQIAQTQINTLLKALRLEKYPPTDIARNDKMLEVTQFCNRGLTIP